MTNVEQLMMQMELGDDSRRRLAEELVRARLILATCQSHRSRLPHQVQTALRRRDFEVETGAPMEGAPGLFDATRRTG